MSRTCTICRHTDRDAINKALVEGRPYRGIAVQFKTSEAAMYRHKRRHLSRALIQSKTAKEEVQADRVFDRLKQLHEETRGILRTALEAGDGRLALQAVARVEKQLELEARLLGELDESTKVAVGVKVEQPRHELYDLSRENATVRRVRCHRT